MKKMLLNAVLILVLNSISFAYDPIDYDTVEVKDNLGNTHKRWIEARWTGNESPFKKYGTYQEWHTNSKLSIIGFYYWDKKESVFSTWFENGRRKEAVNYYNGKKHGRSVEWFYKDYIKTDVYYKNDRLNGLCSWRNYLQDLNNSWLGIQKLSFYLDGDELVVFIVNDVMVNYKSPYYNSKLDLQIEWDKYKTEFHVGKMKDDKKHGKWTTYAPTGEIITQDLYDKGVLVTVEE